VITCPACATECPDGSRFCLRCGSPLTRSYAQPVERKVVTVLFADLVGFTRLCEQTDPEDVDRLLREYYALARSAIEAYGGVVEKFIGDAVAGVFGVPKVHEDDAERAIWAGLRLVERLREISTTEMLKLRVGINTGPVLARLDVDPASGQGFLVGDAVNTAARLQAAAPPMAVVVGQLTHDLALRAFDCEAMDPLTAKGKAERLHPWLVKAPVARTGIDLARTFSSPFVGREAELGILKGLFERAIASQTPQFALVTGEAGIGKSRLIFELARRIERSPDVVAAWRQGRALRHGEGMSFWWLSEIVREQAGIRENDDQETAERRLRHSVPASSDTDWVISRLRPLLGLESAPAPEEENFAAWQRFIELVASERPLVLVFEDSHWARPGTFDFLRHLAAHLSDVPVMVIVAARPELREDHPTFARGEPWTALELRSLSTGETRRLVDRLAGAVAQEIAPVVAERCGGNPFFTEELVRLLRERSGLGAKGRSAAEQGVAVVPDSLTALVAARLDALHPALKAVLTDAAVVGQTFWAGALATMSGTDPLAVDRHLKELAKREFVRPRDVSSLTGETEYAFWHGLTREVAYAQLPRGAKAAKHEAAAKWIEKVVAKRQSDVAEILAHHYETALYLANAAGEEKLASRLLEPTVRSLWAAGNRALPLDAPLAEARYWHALDLMPENGTDRPRLLAAWAEALIRTGRLREAIQALEQAASALRARSDHRGAAVVLTRIQKALFWHDDRRAGVVSEEALALLEGDEASPELVSVLEARAAHLSTEFQIQAGLEAAERAIFIASHLGLEAPREALFGRGVLRVNLGDDEGIGDLRRALTLAIEHGDSMDAATFFYDLADSVCIFDGPRAASEVRSQGLEFSQKRGNRLAIDWLHVQSVQHALWTGDWDKALVQADELEAHLANTDDPLNLLELRWAVARLLTLRGEPERAEPLTAWVAGRSRSQPGNALNCLSSLAAVQVALGDHGAALATLLEVEELSLGKRAVIPYAMALSLLLRTAVQAGDPELAARLLVGVPTRRAMDSRTVAAGEALLMETDGKLDEAAAAYAAAGRDWHDFGAPYEEGQARLGLVRCLLALGRAPEAAPHLAEARTIFARLGARPALAQTDALLSRSADTPVQRT
jgi:class 3 adenylate cyclase/tetratricopeptide (TPR) repeat protein